MEKIFFFSLPVFLQNCIVGFQLMCQETMLILENYFNCRALCCTGSKTECLKHGEAELVGSVV